MNEQERRELAQRADCVSHLSFALEVEEGWPPIAVECLPCTRLEGGYRIESPALFIKGVSVGDILSVELDEYGQVASWSHVSKSRRSVIWLMALGGASVQHVVDGLKALGCNVAHLTAFNLYAIDVPAGCPFEDVDELLEQLDADCAALAFPSLRHAEFSGGL